jgi:plasmid stabilization system protein ParE
MVERRWRVRLGAAAELDFANILKWTTENFGARQSRVYRNTIVQAIGELADGPDVVARGLDEKSAQGQSRLAPLVSIPASIPDQTPTGGMGQ